MMLNSHGKAKLFGATMAAAALVLTTPGSSAADETGDAFIRKAAADGVNFSSRNVVILRAVEVCGLFSAGLSPEAIYTKMVQNYTGFSPNQNAIFMADAVQAYCPRYANQFIS